MSPARGSRGGAPGRQRIFQNFKKAMKILQYFDRKFANFPKSFFKILSNFSSKISKNLEICICLGSGEETPKPANLLKSFSKNQWKPAIFDRFNGKFAIFQEVSNSIAFFRTCGKFTNIHFSWVGAVTLLNT